ncbi:MAG: metallophosphoesterase family protein [Candidatus Eisenbacteria bacterium]
MRYAVLSDVHSNAPALRAVVDSFDANGVNSSVCLGDVVGYGADPVEAVAVIRKLCDVVVRGNHDNAASSEEFGGSFNDDAGEAIAWTRGQLSTAEASYLGGLPLSASYEGARLVHASPLNPGSWTYITRMRDATAAFRAFEEPLCLVGHTHEPVFYVTDGKRRRRREIPRLRMKHDRRYLINVGSVGQPRDGDPRASYAVVDTDEQTVEIVRVPYDTELAGRRIAGAGLPASLAERLTSGR